MIAPPRPALAALEAAVAHVARHHHPLPALAAAGPSRRLALRVMLNVVRELDTLLGHAVAETAAVAGVTPSTPPTASARVALAGLARVLGPGTMPLGDLARADLMREGLVRALASPRAMAQHRLPAIYPHAIGATYRRIARDLALMAGTPGIVADRPDDGSRRLITAGQVAIGDDGAAIART